MRDRSRFSAAFKREVVGELLGGGCSLAQLTSSARREFWIHTVLEEGLRGGGFCGSRVRKPSLARIVELERMVAG
jgi:transposase-like protein